MPVSDDRILLAGLKAMLGSVADTLSKHNDRRSFGAISPAQAPVMRHLWQARSDPAQEHSRWDTVRLVPDAVHPIGARSGCFVALQASRIVAIWLKRVISGGSL